MTERESSRGTDPAPAPTRRDVYRETVVDATSAPVKVAGCTGWIALSAAAGWHTVAARPVDRRRAGQSAAACPIVSRGRFANGNHQGNGTSVGTLRPVILVLLVCSAALLARFMQVG
jgi:hypothetical protein